MHINFYILDNISVWLAKLAVEINATNEKLWLILSEAQVANKLYKNALNSINKAEKINSDNSEIYFTKSNIYKIYNNKCKESFRKRIKYRAK